jgi:eukaryotic-like serine/threonine-protein kinase
VSLARDSKVGRYIIHECIGAGGMGVVYRARDQAHGGRSVALKMIHSEKAADRDFVARFKREAMAISQLDHPLIVKLHEFVEGDPARGEPSYMVLEHLRGKDLGRIIKDERPLPIARAVTLVIEACVAVNACHRLGVVHRDLKPSNIFVTAYDDIESIKLLDFGTARAWQESSRAQGPDTLELTGRGTVLGTPEYFAPEILKGSAVTPKVDQYALGIVLYTALAGEKPFVVDRTAALPDLSLFQLIGQGQHQPLRGHRPEVPEALEAVVARAMNVDPEWRFRNVRELGAALLPWASPACRDRWTGCLTSTDAPATSTRASAIEAAISNLEIQSVSPAAGNDSTLVPPRIEATTRPIATGELRLLADQSRQVTGQLTPKASPLSSAVLDPQVPSATPVDREVEKRPHEPPADPTPTERVSLSFSIPPAPPFALPSRAFTTGICSFVFAMIPTLSFYYAKPRPAPFVQPPSVAAALTRLAEPHIHRPFVLPEPPPAPPSDPAVEPELVLPHDARDLARRLRRVRKPLPHKPTPPQTVDRNGFGIPPSA